MLSGQLVDIRSTQSSVYQHNPARPVAMDTQTYRIDLSSFIIAYKNCFHHSLLANHHHACITLIYVFLGPCKSPQCVKSKRENTQHIII